MVTLPDIDPIVAAALAEDLGVAPEDLLGAPDARLLARDVTAAAVIPPDAVFSGRIVAREPAVVCGLDVAAAAWRMLSRASASGSGVSCEPLVPEGAAVAPGDAVARVAGPARLVLAGERTALDFVMVLSGIATEAARWQARAGERLRVHDTRKTVPGLRALSKYAVAVGGAHNHRMGLYDLVLIKDNHLAAAGGVSAAVHAARQSAPGVRVEVEADTAQQAIDAARAGADIVMLDNMGDAIIADLVPRLKGISAAVQIEVSGSVGFERLEAIAASGADMVSTSALALARPVDFGLDEDR